MGLMARFPDSVPGKLPRLHIWQGWAAPPIQGRAGRWTSELFLSHLCCHNPHLATHPLRPLLLSHLPTTICRGSRCCEIVLHLLSVSNSPLGSANRLPKIQGSPGGRRSWLVLAHFPGCGIWEKNMLIQWGLLRSPKQIGCFHAMDQQGKYHYSNSTHFMDEKTEALKVSTTWH